MNSIPLSPPPERPGFKFVLFRSGTIHAWVIGDERTFCGRKLEETVELVLNDGTQQFKKTCDACQRRYDSGRT